MKLIDSGTLEKGKETEFVFPETEIYIVKIFNRKEKPQPLTVNVGKTFYNENDMQGEDAHTQHEINATEGEILTILGGEQEYEIYK